MTKGSSNLDKQEQKIANVRRAAAQRLKPIPFNAKDRTRLEELKDAKRRAAEQMRSRSSSLGEERGGGVKNGTKTTYPFPVQHEEETKKSTQSNAKIMRQIRNVRRILSGTHKTIPPTKTLPWLVVFMTILLFSDFNPIYDFTIHSVRIDSIWNIIISVGKDLLCLIVLSVYGVAFWSLVSTSLALAFDFVELPGQESGINKNSNNNGINRGYASTKNLYTKLVRKYTAYVTVGIIGAASFKAVLLSLWNNVIRIVFGAIRWFSVGAPTESEESDEAAMKNSSERTWRGDALDATKLMMSYLSIYLLVLLLICGLVFPKSAKPTPKFRGTEKKDHHLQWDNTTPDESLDESTSTGGHSTVDYSSRLPFEKIATKKE